MVQLFSTGRGYTFTPPPPPLPQREWSNGPIHEQAQCSFLTRLPAELRNEIYHHVFKYNAKDYDKIMLELVMENAELSHEEKDKDLVKRQETVGKMIEEKEKEAHPLSLLLTCRKINQEATLLAFHAHTFITQKATSTFHSLQLRTSPLSSAQINAISSIACDVSEAHTYYSYHGGSFIANSLLLFSNLERLELRVKRGGAIDLGLIHSQHTQWSHDGDKPSRAPAWLNTTIERVITGHSFSWQRGQKWVVSWPQDVSGAGALIDAIHTVSGPEAAYDAMHEAGGIIGPCACGCFKPSWIAADLIQETGRKVRLQIVFYGSVQLDKIRELQTHKLKLIPGAEPLQLSTLPSSLINSSASGFGWDGEPEYWEQLRWRKSGLWGKMWMWKGGQMGEEVQQVPLNIETEVKSEEAGNETSNKGSGYGEDKTYWVGMSAGRRWLRDIGKDDERGQPSWWREYWEMTE